MRGCITLQFRGSEFFESSAQGNLWQKLTRQGNTVYRRYGPV